MGKYTELIFGASLKPSTPEYVINSLYYMMGVSDLKPVRFALPPGRCENLFQRSSHYFGVSSPVNSLEFDHINKDWELCVRCNLKNYEGEIETFIDWIKPYVESGSGKGEIFAIVIGEYDEEPTVHRLDKN